LSGIFRDQRSKPRHILGTQLKFDNERELRNDVTP
jgi:hypothetical protein